VVKAGTVRILSYAQARGSVALGVTVDYKNLKIASG